MTFRLKASFVTLATPEFMPLVQFYEQLLRQPPQPYRANRYAEFQLPDLRLAIFKPQAQDQAEFQADSSGCMSLCLAVEDLENAIAHLKQLGYPPPGAIVSAAHGREIYAYDPVGNRLILFEPTPVLDEIR